MVSWAHNVSDFFIMHRCLECHRASKMSNSELVLPFHGQGRKWGPFSFCLFCLGSVNLLCCILFFCILLSKFHLRSDFIPSTFRLHSVFLPPTFRFRFVYVLSSFRQRSVFLPSMFCLPSVFLPSMFCLPSVYVQSSFHLRSVFLPFTFHLPSV